MTLKAARYLEGSTPGLAEFIETTLPFLSFARAREFYADAIPKMIERDIALLGGNDRFFLLTGLLNRKDAIGEWWYDRCREVEADPDDHLDLWARYHGKSSIGTFAGSIQEIINDPEITIVIFGNTLEIAQPFLVQIKEELEGNSYLKRIYADVFWQDPKKEAPTWSADDGIVVKRKGNPKERSVEAHGLMEALPTGRHFQLRIYDDIVTEKSVSQTNTDQIAKTTRRWELSQNLGTHQGGRKWHFGTRYHFGDTYGLILDRGSLKPRIYPATHDGTLNGNPVFLTQEAWDTVKRDQRSTVAAQMLLNPTAGEESTFLMDWLRPYEVRPLLLNVYILGDPSGGKKKTSDRTAISVIGMDINQNLYLLDGYCHRMKLSQRWTAIKEMHRKWKNAPGVQNVRIGYEKYGMQADNEYFEIERLREKIEGMDIEEVNWVREGQQSKDSRIGRLEPFFRNSRFWMPSVVWNPDFGGKCTWTIDAEKQMIHYQPYKGPTRLEALSEKRGELFRILEPIRRLDEDGNVYDLARVLFEEYKLHPFAPHDDFLDATSRVVDMEPTPPMVFERGTLETADYPDA